MREKNIPLIQLIMSITNTVDLVSPLLVNHHKQVAFITYSLANEMGISEKNKRDLLIAGALHDIGGLSLQDRINALNFEAHNPQQHSEVGYALLQNFAPFKEISTYIRFHHVPWNRGRGIEHNGREVPLGSHIIHLADRIAVLINTNGEILGQVDKIMQTIQEQSGKKFHPRLVEVFETLATKEYFWLDAVSNNLIPSLNEKFRLEEVKFDLDSLLNLTTLFARIIDFRSPFTANHSSGVAASAEYLAAICGFSEEECLMIKIAGFLHDLGKLAIPSEIINKTGKLTKMEFNQIRSHTFYTYRALRPIAELDTIKKWGSFHHERLDGQGYPFHLQGEELPWGSRIMAVADVFTALSENRPYRRGMKRSQVLKILKEMAQERALDKEFVYLLAENYEEINEVRKNAQNSSTQEYNNFMDNLFSNPEFKEKELTLS